MKEKCRAELLAELAELDKKMTPAEALVCTAEAVDCIPTNVCHRALEIALAVGLQNPSIFKQVKEVLHKAIDLFASNRNCSELWNVVERKADEETYEKCRKLAKKVYCNIVIPNLPSKLEQLANSGLRS